MIVRVESPGVVSTCSTTTAGGTSTGGCGLGLVGRTGFFCAWTIGANAAKAAAPMRRIRFMSDSIYPISRLYTARAAATSHALSDPDIAKPRRGFLRGFGRSGPLALTLDMKLKRHLHELLHFLTPDLRRRKFHAGERFLNGGGESRVARVQDLERARLVASAL